MASTREKTIEQRLIILQDQNEQLWKEVRDLRGALELALLEIKGRDREWATVPELAEKYSCSQGTIRRRIKANLTKGRDYLQTGQGEYRVRRSAIDNLY